MVRRCSYANKILRSDNLANRTVKLLRYARIPDHGWQRGSVVISKNGKLKPDVMIYKGKEIYCPEGQYCLRTFVGRKSIFRNVGNNPQDALQSREREELLLKARNAANVAGVALKESETPEAYTLAQWGENFLREKQLEPHRSEDGVSAYRLVLDEFIKVCNKSYPYQIETVDILRYCDGIVARGLSERTRSNRFGSLQTFLRYCGVEPNTLLTREQRKKLNRFTKTEVEVYSQEQLDGVLAACHNDYFRTVFEFLLKTGFRMQEAMFLEWSDIDFVHKTVSVRSKPARGFIPKDSEERSVPLVTSLGKSLLAWRKQRPMTRLVFGTRTDKPNDKWLYGLKAIAKRGKLNCGKCGTCVEKEECEQFYLHKFRATYATRLLQNLLDVRTVQKLLGHSDLDSTLRYIQPAQGQVVQDRVNAAFAA